jgi:hypothetical protein
LCLPQSFLCLRQLRQSFCMRQNFIEN